MAEISIVLGTNVTGTLDDITGILTIAGTGAMDNWTSSTYPLKPYKEVIKEVEVQEGITSLGSNCFYTCWSLTSITIPSSVTNLGDYCFYACSALTSITIPSSVTSLGSYCFSSCRGLTSITNRAKTNQTIGSGTFNFTPTTKPIPVYGYLTNTNFKNAVSDTTNFTWNEFEAEEIDTFQLGDNITGTLRTNGILTIAGTGAMDNWTSSTYPLKPYKEVIKEVEVQEGITSLGSNCFSSCWSLTSITIPSSVTNLGSNCFYACSALTSITIPNSVTSLGNYCFSSCLALTSITMSSSVTSLGNYCFSSCRVLTSITIPSSVTSLGDYCFYACRGLTSIANRAKTNQTIGSRTFDFTPTTKPIPVYGHSTNINFKNAVSDTTNFTWNEGMPLIEIPLGDSVVGKLNEENGKLIIEGIGVMNNWGNVNCPLRPYSTSIQTVEIEEGITHIGENCFYSCSNMVSVSLPNTVTSVGGHAFERCVSLSSIELPTGVSFIGEGCFVYCNSIAQIQIPKNVTVLNGSVFRECSNLTSMVLHEAITGIGDYCFKYCTSLKTIKNTSKENQTIGAEAFALGGTDITSVHGYSSNANFKSAVSDTSKFTWNEILQTAPIIESNGSYTVDSSGQYKSALYSPSSSINPANDTDLYYASIPIKLHRYELGNPIVSVGLKDGQHHTQLVDIRTLSTGEFQKCSAIITSKAEWISQPVVFKIGADTAISAKYEFKQPALINLTTTFGEGKEPTKEICDQIFGEFQDGGLYSTYAKVSSDGGLTKYSFYEPVIKGETKVVDGKLVSSESTDASLPKLGSVPSVSDTLDRASGVLVENTSEIILDDNKEYILKENLSDVVRFTTLIENVCYLSGIVSCESDKIKSCDLSYIYNQNREGVASVKEGITISILKSKLATPDVNGFKAWLQANPTTVRYQLATPTQTQLTPTQVATYSQHKKVILLPFAEDKLTLNEDGSSTWVDASNDYVFNGKENWIYEKAYTDEKVYGCYIINNGSVMPKMKDNGLCVSQHHGAAQTFSEEGYKCNGATVSLRILKTKLQTQDLQGFKEYLRNNNDYFKYQLATPTTTHFPKSLTPTIPLNKINNISVGDMVKPTSYNLHYPSDSLIPQIRAFTEHGKNKVNVTDKIKPSLLKALFPVRKLVTATFATGNIAKKISLKVVACNDIGENSTADGVTLYAAPTPQWAYLVVEEKLKIQWKDTLPIDRQYKVRYKVDNGTYQYDFFQGDNTSTGKLHTYEIPLLETQVAEVSICAVDDIQEHFYSDPILMSKATDVNLIPPVNFSHTWLNKNELQLKWDDNYIVDKDYELVYSIDNGEEQIAIIPTTSMSGTGEVYAHTVILNELQTIVAKVRMRWNLNNSNWANQTVLHNLARPENVQFQILREGTRISWDKSVLAEWYKVFLDECELATVIETEALITQELNGNIYVVACREGFVSEPSDSVFVKSKPNAPVNLNVKFDEYGDEYNFNVSFIDNSHIETSYRVEYAVDGKAADIIEIAADEVIPPNSTIDPQDPFRLNSTFESKNGEDIIVKNCIETILNEDGTIADKEDATVKSLDGSYVVFVA